MVSQECQIIQPAVLAKQELEELADPWHRIGQQLPAYRNAGWRVGVEAEVRRCSVLISGQVIGR
ncbi:MAG: hypothetical protein OHK0022_40560 [Roseiflexaceae bacterium]